MRYSETRKSRSKNAVKLHNCLILIARGGNFLVRFKDGLRVDLKTDDANPLLYVSAVTRKGAPLFAEEGRRGSLSLASKIRGNYSRNVQLHRREDTIACFA